jgi:hypothetical protein
LGRIGRGRRVGPVSGVGGQEVTGDGERPHANGRTDGRRAKRKDD